DAVFMHQLDVIGTFAEARGDESRRVVARPQRRNGEAILGSMPAWNRDRIAAAEQAGLIARRVRLHLLQERRIPHHVELGGDAEPAPPPHPAPPEPPAPPPPRTPVVQAVTATAHSRMRSMLIIPRRRPERCANTSRARGEASPGGVDANFSRRADRDRLRRRD